MSKKRRYSWPDQHWNWPVDLTHQHGVRSGGLVFTGGQAALDQHGVVQHPQDLPAQLDLVMRYVEAVLQDLDAGLEDVVKLVCYFTGNAADETLLLEAIATRFGSSLLPAINTVCMPALCYPDMRVEIEAVAAIDERSSEDSKGPADTDQSLPAYRQQVHCPQHYPITGGYPHAVRAGELLFTSDICARSADGEVQAPGDVIEQTRIAIERLEQVLQAAGCGGGDVLKINVYYSGDGTAENWEQPALIRASYFNKPGPAATGLTVDSFAQLGLMTKLFVTAMRARNGNVMPKRYVWPDGHWDWTAPLPYQHGNQCGQLIHLGGQVSLDTRGQVIDANDMVKQTHRAMDNIRSVLEGFDATLDDVVKVTTFYQGTASAEELHQNLTIRSGSYTKPGPATTGVPVPRLVYENMVIEIEVIAIVDNRITENRLSS